jgi:uncharacterized protein (DUF952 family)
LPNSVQPPPSSVPIEKNGHITYHLAPRDHWEAQAANSSYLPERFEDEGFIHCTDTIEDIIAVGNRYYQRDARPYLLLEIDCTLVAAPIVYEDPGKMFPHIYGPLEIEAVRELHGVARDAAGWFLSVGPMERP